MKIQRNFSIQPNAKVIVHHAFLREQTTKPKTNLSDRLITSKAIGLLKDDQRFRENLA